MKTLPYGIHAAQVFLEICWPLIKTNQFCLGNVRVFDKTHRSYPLSVHTFSGILHLFNKSLNSTGIVHISVYILE